MSHHTGVQFTTFPSHTIELTNQTREERPAQKMNKHVPAFQLEASVRCQVSGTDAEVKANREKTVNTWLEAVIFSKSERESKREAPGGLGGGDVEMERDALLVGGTTNRWFQRFNGGTEVNGDRDTRTTRSGTDTTQCLRFCQTSDGSCARERGRAGGSSNPVMLAIGCM